MAKQITYREQEKIQNTMKIPSKMQPSTRMKIQHPETDYEMLPIYLEQIYIGSKTLRTKLQV